jgi:hypothetical protein
MAATKSGGSPQFAIKKLEGSSVGIREVTLEDSAASTLIEGGSDVTAMQYSTAARLVHSYFPPCLRG